jgi:mono/diheme cytochrome c family protein
MRKVFKWLAILVGVVIGLALITVLGMYISTTLRINKIYSINVDGVQISSDAAEVARGKAWVSSECTHCHGSNLAGKTIFEDPKLGNISSMNLTPGKGGMGSKFSDLDWVRAIRYGVNQEGRSLIAMPASDFYHFSDRDLGAIIAYLKTLPPVDQEWQEPQFTPLAKVLISANAFGKIIEAELIDPNAPRPAVPPAGATSEYGAYLVEVSGCRSCHHANLAGGKVSNPQSPKARNLTPGGELVGWTAADFMDTLRTGVTPSGHALNPEFMPWSDFKNMTDEQLTAIWNYLQTLPALPLNQD